jgi:YVTN family beta-propeller protein
MRRSPALVILVTLAPLAAVTAGVAQPGRAPRLGRQPDGSFLVSTGQRVPAAAVAFPGRPIDLALHPSGRFFAVLSKSEVFLADPGGVIAGSAVAFPKKAGPAFRGLAWAPDGNRLFASMEKGDVWTFALDGRALRAGPVVAIPRPGTDPKANPVPGGMCFTRDGKRLFVAAANRSAVVEIDPAANAVVKEYPAQLVPFEPRLSEDERTLIVSNWGGRPANPGERTAKSDNVQILVDERGAPASGTVSLIDRASGAARHVEVGIHPCALAVAGHKAYVANAMSDSVSVIDIPSTAVERTIPIRWDRRRILGSMPNALAVRGSTLYAGNGGDNALCEIDLTAGAVRGFRPAGFFPCAVALAADGRSAYVLNTKGHGSVAKTLLGRPGNAHDFQGTVSVVDLTGDLAGETAAVARNNHWRTELGRPPALKVYNGAIKHVVYVIKENRTYDEIFGDLPVGDGDPKLCSLGETVMPNHRRLALQFTLFDNAYVSGTNSADGHAWSTQCLANDYLERFYVGYSRSYSDDGEDAMAYSNGGAIWDAAVKKGKSVRVWGEFCEDSSAIIEPKPKDWFEVWEDRKAGGSKFKFTPVTLVPGLKNLIAPGYIYWPLWQSDQARADIFIREYEQFSKTDTVPDLMVLSLPCDHGEGTDPRYPTPRAMMADNDLALGRIVEAITKSPQWKETCIFVVEDDAQSGPDHVDGHRSCFLALSPYTRRGFLDSTLYTQTNMIRSIGLMLGLEPLNQFDLYAYPMEACFRDTPDFGGYEPVPNNVPLDERNPSGARLTPADQFWLVKTRELNWKEIDGPDPYWLNRINWYSIHKGMRPYPERAGERPGADLDDDE